MFVDWIVGVDDVLLLMLLDDGMMTTIVRVVVVMMMMMAPQLKNLWRKRQTKTSSHHIDEGHSNRPYSDHGHF